jgi:hypothetical protein
MPGFLGFLFVLLYWGLNSGPTPGALHQPLFVMDFSEIGSRKLFAQAGFEHDPPDLCLLSSWDYRREPPAPGMANLPNQCAHIP